MAEFFFHLSIAFTVLAVFSAQVRVGYMWLWGVCVFCWVKIFRVRVPVGWRGEEFLWFLFG